MSSTINTSRGFSLIELMVAMVIGLIILAAVSTVLVNSNKNYNTTDSMARMQENARFAVEFIGRDLRRAGNVGCVGTDAEVRNTVNGYPATGGVLLNPLEGTNNIVASGIWAPSGLALALPDMVIGTDAVTMRYLDMDNKIPIVQSMPNESAVLWVTQGHGLVVGDIIAVADCSSADIMQLTNVNDAGGGSGKDNLVHNAGSTPSPGNSTQKLSKKYGTDSAILKTAAHAYFIGQPAGRPNRALFRTSPAGPQEIVEGIEDMQITYGEATSGNAFPELYVTADKVVDWKNVVSVRVGLLVGTVANTADGQLGADTDSGVYIVNDASITAKSERRIRKVFVSTFQMRNLHK